MLTPVRLSSVCRLSVCRLSSVTLLRPTQAVQIFDNIATALGTWPSFDIQNFTEIVPGEPLRQGS